MMPVQHKLPARASRMHGLSLVELLVALTVSLLLLAGVFQIYLGNRQSYETQQGINLVQEGGRFATLFMSRTIRHGGYLSSYTQRPGDVFTAAAPPVSGSENGANPDDITIRYQGQADGLVLDCLGQPVPVNTVVASQFTLGNPDASGLRSLRCQRLGIDALAQPLVQGVQNMQILYGIDASNNGVRDTSNYVTADNIPDWTTVRSVRLDLTVSDNDEIGNKNFTATVAIRNRLDDF